jgi:hypothetical protein
MFSLIESLAYAKEIGIIFFFKTNISIIKKTKKKHGNFLFYYQCPGLEPVLCEGAVSWTRILEWNWCPVNGLMVRPVS